MSVLYLVLPLAVAIVAGMVWAFVRSVGHGQFDDLETPALRMLFDDEPRRDRTPAGDAPPPSAGSPSAGSPTAGSPTAGSPTAGSPIAGSPAPGPLPPASTPPSEGPSDPTR